MRHRSVCDKTSPRNIIPIVVKIPKAAYLFLMLYLQLSNFQLTFRCKFLSQQNQLRRPVAIVTRILR